MEISSTVDGDRVLVRVSGRIDALESARFWTELQTQLELDVSVMIADLGAVDYVDSSGLAVLVRSWRQQQAAGRRFTVALPTSDSARRIFSLTGFDDVFDLVEAADAHRWSPRPG